MQRYKMETIPEPEITPDFGIGEDLPHKVPLNIFLTDYRSYGLYNFDEGKAFYGNREGMSRLELTETDIENDYIDYSFPYIYWRSNANNT